MVLIPHRVTPGLFRVYSEFYIGSYSSITNILLPVALFVAVAPCAKTVLSML